MNKDEMKHDLRWFEEYAENADTLKPLTPKEWKELAALLHEVNSRTVMLEWIEPWPACGPEGNTLDAHVTLRATVHDCINLQRAADRQAGRPTMGDDARRIDEFMVVHWATVVQPNRII